MRTYHTINERTGGVRPLGGGPPSYRPNRQDWPDLPDPLRECDKCHEHAAFFGPDDRGAYYCGRCVGRVDIFHLNHVGAKSAHQMRADPGACQTQAVKYAGIGSRSTPQDILDVMQDFAYAAARNATLRSGGAQGADLAFEFGATLGGGRKEIYLPWKGFNGCQDGTLTEPSEAAYELAERHHPGWRYLKQGARKLIARNGHQVLGKDLDDPVDMIICWTPDGSLDGKGPKSGGTGQALRIAHEYEIGVLNLKDEINLEWVKEAISDDGIPLS